MAACHDEIQGEIAFKPGAEVVRPKTAPRCQETKVLVL